MSTDYISLISLNFPNLQVECFGESSDYNNLSAVLPHVLPSKEELDALETNPSTILQDAFKANLARCNSEYELAVEALRGTYPFSETTTWPIQLDESRLYGAWRDGGKVGPAPLTLFLSVLTAERDARGIGAGLEDLVDRVLTNNNLYSTEMARLTAIRHSTEFSMYMALNAGDLEALNAITWIYWPQP
jgi:hypothetical protein